MEKPEAFKADLERVREWAWDKLRGESEPPWTRYQYMKLVESVTAILDGMAATKVHSPLRLVEEGDAPESAPDPPDRQKPTLPF